MGVTKYSPNLCVDLTKEMAAGKSDTEVMAKWGVSRGTFYKWKREFPEFQDAHDIGKVMFDSIHEGLGVQAMHKAIDLDYNYWKDLGKFRHGWTDKTSAGTTNTINIDTMNVLNNQTNEELLCFIKSQLEANPELARIIEHEPE